MVLKKVFLFVTLICPSFIFADSTKTHVYAIPGMFGGGSTNEYLNQLLGNEIEITQVEIPGRTRDLGQSRCMAYLKKVCEENPDRCFIVHATSQGTATALNYCARYKDKNIKALILEAPLVSANSAIIHTMRGPSINKPGLAKLPLAYYWLPYVAKCVMPFYSPSGPQVIKLLSAIPTDIPIIIIHAKHDPQIPFDDACALYYGLRLYGNDHVYLITLDKDRHTTILKSIPHLQEGVRAILQKYGLIEGKNLQALTEYQPNTSPFKKLYEELLAKEVRHAQLGIIVTTMVLLLFVFLACLIIKTWLKRRRK